MKKILRNFGLLIGTIFVSIALGEVIVRIVAPQQLIKMDLEDLWRSDSTFGIRRRENINLLVNNGEGYHRIITDQFGYRISEPVSPENPAAPPDFAILAIGDSFLEAFSVDNNNTIPEALGELISKKYRMRIYSANAGMSNWDPNQYFLETKRSLALRHFDLGLVFIYTGNDIITRIDTTLGYQRIPRHWTLPTKIALQRWVISNITDPTRALLEQYSHLYTLCKQVAYTFFAKIGKTMAYIYAEFRVSERNSPRWEVTAELCSLIRDLFARYNTPVIFVLIPTTWQTNEELFHNYVKLLGMSPDSVDLDQPNKLLAASFQKRALPLLDPLPYMRAQADQGIKLYGKIDRHLNENGHLAIADFIFPKIENYIIERQRMEKSNLEFNIIAKK